MKDSYTCFLSWKGHAAPILYAAWAEVGLFPEEDMLKLRKIDCDLEGHPTPVSFSVLNYFMCNFNEEFKTYIYGGLFSSIV